MVNAVQDDFRGAGLLPADRALAEAADKLTRTPSAMTKADTDRLRGHGFDDEAIHDAMQTAAYFNYINRVCDGLGIDLEDSMPTEPQGWKRHGA